ncbi:hypothetical protein ACG83_33235 [Frankia sp. R43]|uniref:hypothetical protein n=1 Tax=Frankia sp. R43 TaxID=269536 RepID=UPI0006CA35A7|nr:hypothetical protein [Frankia sp. R43]KPM51692.1 hypothetical protein ACG83_33235 [Frankia sp. R43]
MTPASVTVPTAAEAVPEGSAVCAGSAAADPADPAASAGSAGSAGSAVSAGSAGAARLTVTSRTVAKLGRADDENEDCCAACPERGRFAIADGASTSARPEVWSRLLVHAFVGESLDPLAPEVLAGLRERWWEQVSRPGLPWYARAKLQSGADASFLGLCVDVERRRWVATCVGDSCVFHLSGGRTRAAGPVLRAEDFSRFAQLVGSRGAAVPAPTVLGGTYQPGDVFVLATDALARLLLCADADRGRMPSPGWLAHSAGRFARMVAAYRHHGCLANDDTTICVVQT